MFRLNRSDHQDYVRRRPRLFSITHSSLPVTSPTLPSSSGDIYQPRKLMIAPPPKHEINDAAVPAPTRPLPSAPLPSSYESDPDPSKTVFCTAPHDRTSPLVQYGLMIDAGSTGSRIHVYKFNNCGPSPAYE